MPLAIPLRKTSTVQERLYFFGQKIWPRIKYCTSHHKHNYFCHCLLRNLHIFSIIDSKLNTCIHTCIYTYILITNFTLGSFMLFSTLIRKASKCAEQGSCFLSQKNAGVKINFQYSWRL